MGNYRLSNRVKNKIISSQSRPVLLSVMLIAMVAGGGCATSAVLSNSDYKTKSVQSHTVKKVLLNDSLVAFGRPANPLPNLPEGKVVIVGEKQSYVLTTGGEEMISILTSLDPTSIKVDSDMSFYSPNDGYFSGEMQMSYAKMKDELTPADYQYFLQNGTKECTTNSDDTLNAQRFCFVVPIKGVIYPPVKNLDLIQSKYNALTKPYPMTIYTSVTTEEETVSRDFGNGIKTVVALPFAVAFDVVVMPVVLAIFAVAD